MRPPNPDMVKVFKAVDYSCPVAEEPRLLNPLAGLVRRQRPAGGRSGE